MSKKVFMIGLIGMTLFCAPTSADAQAAKAVVKGIQAISKAASKGGGKAATKAGTTAGAATAASEAKAASKAGTSKVATEAERTKNVRPVTYNCTNCNGSGTVSEWNSYYGRYQSTTCSRCSGRGKVTRIIRY